MDAKAIRTVFTALSSTESLFQSRFSSDMFTSEIDYGCVVLRAVWHTSCGISWCRVGGLCALAGINKRHSSMSSSLTWQMRLSTPSTRALPLHA